VGNAIPNLSHKKQGGRKTLAWAGEKIVGQARCARDSRVIGRQGRGRSAALDRAEEKTRVPSQEENGNASSKRRSACWKISWGREKQRLTPKFRKGKVKLVGGQGKNLLYGKVPNIRSSEKVQGLQTEVYHAELREVLATRRRKGEQKSATSK